MVVDEPMYAYYLNHTGLKHPGGDQVLATLPIDIDIALSHYFFQAIDTEYLFIKGMAHHYEGLQDLSFLNRLNNVFLIRNPKQLIASFAQVISEPTIRDIGLKHEYELFKHLLDQGQEPIVIDSGELLKNPPAMIKKLCHCIDIPFDTAMLQWDKGPKPYDGVWAPHWYHNVWDSTCFAPQKTSTRSFPSHLGQLLDEAQEYYQLLIDKSITI